MPEWLIWAVAIWFVYGVMSGRGCSWSGRRLHRLHSGSRGRDLGRSRSTGSEVARELARPRAPRTPAPPRETAEERIRRRFVEGRTTLDEYEAELWEELRPKGSGS